MKKTIALIILLSTTLNLIAQQDTKLPGLVVEQNSKYKYKEVNYLANVSIKSVGSTPQLSDANGKFELIFSDKPPGNTIRIYAQKSGYEVVNRREIEQAAVLDRIRPLKIVMCKEGQLAENTIEYYGIATRAIEKRYQEQIATIEKGGDEAEALKTKLQEQINLTVTEQSKVIDELKKQKEKALAHAHEISQKFAEVNLDDQDSLYIAAYEAFLQEDFDAIFRILDYERLRASILAAKEAIAKGEQFEAEADSLKIVYAAYLKKSAKNALMAARSAHNEGLVNEAIKHYQLSLEADSTVIDVWWEYAQYLSRARYTSFLRYDLDQAKATLYLVQYYEENEISTAQQDTLQNLLQSSREKLLPHKDGKEVKEYLKQLDLFLAKG